MPTRATPRRAAPAPAPALRNVQITREGWLSAATDAMRPMFIAAGAPIPAGRAAIGFTSHGSKGKRIGECWNPVASGDKHYEIFITPTLDDVPTVIGVLAHELCHAALPLGAGHGPLFKRLAHAIGLTGRMTSAFPGPELAAKLAVISDDLGPLPHAALRAMQRAGERKKHKVNMLKASCEDCDYVVRLTAVHARKGAPLCGVHHSAMSIDWPEGEAPELDDAGSEFDRIAA